MLWNVILNSDILADTLFDSVHCVSQQSDHIMLADFNFWVMQKRLCCKMDVTSSCRLQGFFIWHMHEIPDVWSDTQLKPVLPTGSCMQCYHGFRSHLTLHVRENKVLSLDLHRCWNSVHKLSQGSQVSYVLCSRCAILALLQELSGLDNFWSTTFWSSVKYMCVLFQQAGEQTLQPSGFIIKLSISWCMIMQKKYLY